MTCFRETQRMFVEIFILCHFFIFSCYATYSGCPEHSIVEPCSCFHRPGTNILFCAGLKDSEVLAEVAERSSNWTFHSLFICQSDLQHIPASFFLDQQIRSVVVANSNMSSLFDQKPEEGNLLETLHLNDVRFDDGIQRNMVDGLSNLHSFNLQFEEIPFLGIEITQRWGIGLRQLCLSNTRTKVIEDGALAHLAELVELKIRHCEVTSLERNMFPSPAKINVMDFTSNQIETLPDNIFLEMPDLREVYFRENRITQLSSSLLEFAIDNFHTLNLIGNPLDCNCDFKILATKVTNILNGACASPEEKKGVRLSSLTVEDFSFCL